MKRSEKLRPGPVAALRLPSGRPARGRRAEDRRLPLRHPQRTGCNAFAKRHLQQHDPGARQGPYDPDRPAGAIRPARERKDRRRGAGALRRKTDPGRLRDRGKPHPVRQPREPRRQGRHRGNGRRDHRALRPGRGDRKHGGLRGTARPGHPRESFRHTGHRPDRSDGQPADREHRHLQRSQGREGQTLLRRGPLVRHPGHLPDGLLHGREGRCHGQRRRQR